MTHQLLYRVDGYIFATSFLCTQQGFRFGAQRQSLIGVGLLLAELQLQVFTIALHILPAQPLHIFGLGFNVG